MMSEVLMLIAPLVVLLVGLLWWHWDEKRWEARSRAISRPVNVRPFPNGLPTYARPLDVHAGRAARRARHGGTP